MMPRLKLGMHWTSYGCSIHRRHVDSPELESRWHAPTECGGCMRPAGRCWRYNAFDPANSALIVLSGVGIAGGAYTGDIGDPNNGSLSGTHGRWMPSFQRTPRHSAAPVEPPSPPLIAPVPVRPKGAVLVSDVAGCMLPLST